MNIEEAWEVFDGLMLGDGSLIRYKNTVCFRMNVSKNTISISDHLKYLEWLRDSVFAVLSIRATVKLYWGTRSAGVKKGQMYQYVSLRTERIPLLADYYSEWYAGGEWSDGSSKAYIRYATKVLPERIVGGSSLPISSLTHWFLGDGDSYRNKRKLSTVIAGFSTYCFSKVEVYHLITILNNMGIKTTKPSEREHKKGSGLRIILAQESTDYLIHLVESRILEIFGDSVGPSYKDMIKYKHSTNRHADLDRIDRIRRLLRRRQLSEH